VVAHANREDPSRRFVYTAADLAELVAATFEGRPIVRQHFSHQLLNTRGFKPKAQNLGFLLRQMDALAVLFASPL
jgi:hypothetical protein